jgi:hypothetical protein
MSPLLYPDRHRGWPLSYTGTIQIVGHTAPNPFGAGTTQMFHPTAPNTFGAGNITKSRKISDATGNFKRFVTRTLRGGNVRTPKALASAVRPP